MHDILINILKTLDDMFSKLNKDISFNQDYSFNPKDPRAVLNFWKRYSLCNSNIIFDVYVIWNYFSECYEIHLTWFTRLDSNLDNNPGFKISPYLKISFEDILTLNFEDILKLNFEDLGSDFSNFEIRSQLLFNIEIFKNEKIKVFPKLGV